MKKKPWHLRRLGFERLEGRFVLSAVPGFHQVAAVAHARMAPVLMTSTNWSGYATEARAGTVTSVSGSWKVPKVTGRGTGYSSVWVGIDGSNSSTVEQIGTDSDIINGRAEYYAWYEMYPSDSVNIPSMTIKPGDSITASVTFVSGNKFRLTISDGSQTFTTVQAVGGATRSSAEWIVEAPSSYSGTLPLANFGSVSFSGASAVINGVRGPIDNGWAGASPERINMTTGFGTAMDTTGPLAATTAAPATSSFTVSYNTASAAAPARPSYYYAWGWWGWNWSPWRQTDIFSQVDTGRTAANSRDWQMLGV